MANYAALLMFSVSSLVVYDTSGLSFTDDKELMEKTCLVQQKDVTF